MSISEEGEHLAIAGYDKNTVTLYDASNKTIDWQQNCFKKPVNVVILNNYNDMIFLETENQGSFFLNKRTGKVIAEAKDIEFIKENQYSNKDHFIKKYSSEIINRDDGKVITTINNMSFAILDSCFTMHSIMCSYAAGPLCAISLESSKILWTTSVTGHFLNIEYCEQLNKIIAIRWEYEIGGPKYLSYINIDTGIIEREMDLGKPISIEFLKKGSLIITSQGKLYSALTYELLKQMDFESK
jgi:hypothetical protein